MRSQCLVMFDLAARSIEAGLLDKRRKCDTHAATIVAGFEKAGFFNGSAHKQTIHEAGATELHSRALLLCEALVKAHEAMSAAPSDELRSRSKDWIADRVQREAADIERHLYSPRAAF